MRAVFRSPFFWPALLWFLFVALFASKGFPYFMSVGGDFDLYYAVGELFKIGLQKELFNGVDFAPVYGYIPIGAPLFGFLTALPWTLSKEVYFFLRIFLFFMWPFLLWTVLPQDKSKDRSTLIAAILACILISPSVYEDIRVGNVNILFVTLIILAAKCLKELKPKTAVAFLTPVALMKPHYAVFMFPFLGMAPVGAILTTGAVTGALFLFSLTFFSLQDLALHFQSWYNLIKQPIAGPQDVNNMSWFGLITRLFTPLDLTEAEGLPSIHIGVLQPSTITYIVYLIKSSLLFSGLTSIFLILKSKTIGKVRDANILLMGSASMLLLSLSPTVWQTYWMLLLFPLFFLFLRLKSSLRPIALPLIVAFAVTIYSPGFLFQFSQKWRVKARAFALPQPFVYILVVLLAYEAYLLYTRYKNSPTSGERLTA